MKITVIGGGLAGAEAAWQAACHGCTVTLFEMKPEQYSPAHHSPDLAELVCSNSFRSSDPHSAVGLLKEEMQGCNSLIMDVASRCRVPAGKALAVNREKFAREITATLENHPAITIVRQEICEIPPAQDSPLVLATGPLTSAALTASLVNLTGVEHLAFYDAIAPIVDAASLDMGIVYQKSRYDEGPGDYLNCPMNKEEYLHFINELATADTVALHSFEKAKYFEGCLPIEVMRARGDETLRFGPLKPVGLPDPRTNKDPYAVVQLRKENCEGTSYNLVGFQTKLTYGEQKRIFRLIPGLAHAEFLRYGSIHRNTFVCSPQLLQPHLAFKKRPELFLAGQLSGVEGYVESTAIGMLAGINAARMVLSKDFLIPPRETALGALIFHLTQSEPKRFQPSNINFGLFVPFKKKIPKKFRGAERAAIARDAFKSWRNTW